jgi:hypothetical protein
MAGIQHDLVAVAAGGLPGRSGGRGRAFFFGRSIGIASGAEEEYREYAEKQVETHSMKITGKRRRVQKKM